MEPTTTVGGAGMKKKYDLSKMKCRRNPCAERLRQQSRQSLQIQSLADRIAEEISPQRIVLFGSHRLAPATQGSSRFYLLSCSAGGRKVFESHFAETCRSFWKNTRP
jgi:hypothetical protein